MIDPGRKVAGVPSSSPLGKKFSFHLADVLSDAIRGVSQILEALELMVWNRSVLVSYDQMCQTRMFDRNQGIVLSSCDDHPGLFSMPCPPAPSVTSFSLSSASIRPGVPMRMCGQESWGSPPSALSPKCRCSGWQTAALADLENLRELHKITSCRYIFPNVCYVSFSFISNIYQNWTKDKGPQNATTVLCWLIK